MVQISLKLCLWALWAAAGVAIISHWVPLAPLAVYKTVEQIIIHHETITQILVWGAVLVSCMALIAYMSTGASIELLAPVAVLPVSPAPRPQKDCAHTWPAT